MAEKSKGRLISAVINNEFVKMCEITKNGKNMTVHKMVTIPTPRDCYEDGLISNEKALAAAMKKAISDNRMKTENIAFTANSNKIATKEVLIPDVKENKIGKLIQANASEYFPVNIEDYTIQSTVLDKVQDEGQIKLKVMVIAAPNEVIEPYYRLAKELGLKVAFVDYAGNSTYQVVKKQVDVEETCVVAEVENDVTVVSIFNNGALQMQRTIPYGKSLLVNNVMEMYNLDYDRALNKLQTQTLLHSRFDGDPTTESVRYLVGNINRVVDYYVSRNNVPITKAYILGNATSVYGFVTLVSNELNMQFIKVDKLRGIVADKRTYVDETAITSYIANVGAMIDPVNFVPKTVVEQEQKKGSGKETIFVLAAAVLAAGILVAYPGVQYLSLKSDVDSLNTQINSLKGIEPVVNEYYEAKDQYEDALAFATMSVNNNDTLQNFITYLEEKLPSDVVITSMNVSSGAVTVSGTAASKSSVAKTIQQLQTIPSVANVKVASETESKDNTGTIQATFSLTCTFTSVAKSNN